MVLERLGTITIQPFFPDVSNMQLNYKNKTHKHNDVYINNNFLLPTIWEP